MAGKGKPRLMIREMVLENFKSYAGQQRIGPFHKCFSCVVGPNGSGKSNVIDAMLFVFGRRAKQLRFNKVSELIHNSTHHRNLERACVTVHFQEILDQGDEEFEVVPGSEFTVARTANRSNTSDYYVNGRRLGAKEVAEMLKSKGIDLDNNRFLILQGEVEAISLMKPKGEDKGETGLLEYLEDIIGTNTLITSIEEEGKRLEEMSDKRQSLIAKLKAVEKEVEGLEGRKLEAEAYLGKQAERVRRLLAGNSLKLRQEQASLAEAESKVADFSAHLEKQRAKVSVFDAELAAVAAAVEAADKDAQQVSAALEAAQEEFRELERRDTKVRADLKHVTAKQKKLADKRRDAEEAEAKLAADVDAASDAAGAAAAIEALSQQLAQEEEVLEGLLQGIKGEVEGLHQQLSKVRAELAPWEAQMAEVQSRMDVATSERDLFRSARAAAAGRLQAARDGLESATKAAEEQDGEITRMERGIKDATLKAAAAQKELAAATQQEGELEAHAGELRRRVGALRSDTEGQASQGAVMQALSEAQSRGAVSGVHGRLGDLGAIDGRYDVAVSTACPSLDYVVVDSTADAQRCVELLRKGGLGVATFLILDKQRGLEREMRDRPQPPSGVRRLFDLVKVKEERLKVAFWFAMRNTLVAEDLEQATSIAYGQDRRWGRVVTLQGQLISEAGTMSGGGGRPRGGRMRLGSAPPAASARSAQEAAAELKKAEAELARAEAQLRAARDARDAAERALREAQKQLRELEVALPKAQQSADAARAAAADLSRRLSQLEAATHASAEDEARLKELEATISRETVAAAKLRASTSGLQRSATALQEKIDAAGGDRLRKQRDKVAKLQKGVADAEAEATRRAVQGKAAAKQLDKLRKAMQKDGAETERLASEGTALRSEIDALTATAEGVMQRQAELEEALKAKSAALEAARAQADAKQQEAGRVKGAELETEAALAKCRGARKDHAANIKALGREVEALASKLGDYAIAGQPPPVALTEEELTATSADDCFYQAQILAEEVRLMSPNMDAIAAYAAKAGDLASRQQELRNATVARDEVRRSYESLRKRRLDGFMEGFNAIALKLKEMYQMITLGGDAELELVDTLDPFSEGIVFSVRPPKKSWKQISNLSGGEKTLSSLSLVFALHHYKPTPLYVMDEIDAALDFKNVSIVGHYIKERTKDAQFVIISLRNNMFELADRLVGIYKTDHATKTVTINPGAFVLGRDAQQARDQEQGHLSQQQSVAVA